MTISELAFRASRSTVYSLFSEQVRRAPSAIAMQHAGRSLTYAQLHDAVIHAAGRLTSAGLQPGDRVAVLSENCLEYIQVQLAAARLGAIVACLNWRLTAPELKYCIDLVEPRLLLVSTRHMALRGATGSEVEHHDLQAFLAAGPGYLDVPAPDVDPENGLLLLYTSGTTGHPKAALISHRAEIARMCALRLDLGLAATDTYIAWSPMFHMGGTEHTLAALMSGGSVVVIDGMDADAVVDALAQYQVGWLLLVPATIEPVLARLEARRVVPRGVRMVGCMADLVPRELIVRASTMLGAPFLNSFGSTETGMPPASADAIPIGTSPENLGKRLSSLCEVRIVDTRDRDVEPGEPGEVLVRGPTLFSGYWNAHRVNSSEFRDGWFRMGDLFKAVADSRYEFVGRTKYLIKTGGENVYPAEIERVLLADERIVEAAVVRRLDDRWGEVPVAFVTRRTEEMSAADVFALCRSQLASYKCPKDVHFIEASAFPRNVTGKIVREDLERLLCEPPAPSTGSAS